MERQRYLPGILAKQEQSCFPWAVIVQTRTVIVWALIAGRILCVWGRAEICTKYSGLPVLNHQRDAGEDIFKPKIGIISGFTSKGKVTASLCVLHLL